MASRDVEKLAALAATIDQESAQEANSLAYQARLFAQTSLPHGDPGDVPAWGRANGRLSLVIQPGMYLDERTGEPRSIGYPYGNVPRLVMAWMSTEAVRTKSRVLYLGDTLSGFLAELGMWSSGGPRGDRTRFRKQLERLLAARIFCRYEDPEQGVTGGASFGVADGYWLWWDPKEPNPSQGQLLPSTISLSEAFFEQVTTRPVPVDIRVLRGIKSSALALDIYTWLTYRLSYLQKPTHISWTQVRGQFGSKFKDTRQGRFRFREEFEQQLRNVLEFYRDANVRTSPQGVLLLPSRPHVSRSNRPALASAPTDEHCVHGGESGTLPNGQPRCPSCRRS